MERLSKMAPTRKRKGGVRRDAELDDRRLVEDPLLLPLDSSSPSGRQETAEGKPC